MKAVDNALVVGSVHSQRNIKILSAQHCVKLRRKGKVYKSEKAKFIIKCKHDRLCSYHIGSVRADVDKNSQHRHTDERLFKVTKVVLGHSCSVIVEPLKDFSRQKQLPLTSSSIALVNSVMTSVNIEKRNGPTGRRIRSDIEIALGISEGEMQEMSGSTEGRSLPYRVGRFAKQFRYGTWEDGVCQLPALKLRLESADESSSLFICRVEVRYYLFFLSFIIVHDSSNNFELLLPPAASWGVHCLIAYPWGDQEGNGAGAPPSSVFSRLHICEEVDVWCPRSVVGVLCR